jgi:hypothetical protein
VQELSSRLALLVPAEENDKVNSSHVPDISHSETVDVVTGEY